MSTLLVIDSTLDAFRLLLKQGMTPLEALRQFDSAQFNAALRSEIDCGNSELLKLAARAGREEMNERDLDQAIELWLAGWTSEIPNSTQTDIMSWYWRRPSKRIGHPGRRFMSTQQALNALRKE